MPTITRRAALGTALFGGAAACTGPKPGQSIEAAIGSSGALFAYGVASGDPRPDSVVLWTRVSPSGVDAMPVRWEIAQDAEFSNTVASGDAEARFESDFTVKAVATSLVPGAHYFYRFSVGDARSPVGRTKTLPTGALDAARFAVVSCSNYPFGYFNVYDLIARRDDLDAVIHLGDYIYEYGRDGYGGETGAALGRGHEPPHEIRTLADYRRRHAQYKADPASQAAHAAHPFIAIWDDHETANDSWAGGAENHSPDAEGDWAARKRAAMQAYYEWMPIRDPDAGRPREAIFRAFSFGDLLTVAALETRLMARAKPFEYNEIVPTLTSPEAVANFRDNTLWAPDREMMGVEQLDFVKKSLQESVAAGQPWRLIANQVIMAKVTAPNLAPHLTEADIVELESQWDQARSFIMFSTLGLPTNLDAWDGYPAARERFYETVRFAGADGLVVVTGDTHTWWANDLKAKDGAHMGVELGVHSLTSPSPYRKSFLGGKGEEYALLTGNENPDVRYISGEDHGYIALTVTRDEMHAQFIAVDTIEAPRYQSFMKAAFKIRKSGGAAQFVDVDGLTLAERAVF
ncbi:MAG: alkaline phosphatase D family protein [Pseudomonadota bacterium]